MNANEWINLDRTVTSSKRYYAHFDLRMDIGQQKEYILSADKIAAHSFYPFIHYKKDMTKYKSGVGKKPKERDICYAAHIDRCIYQYYSFVLNELYNKRLKRDNISNVPVAYRTDLHKNNIHFAKRAFDFIKSSASAHIMIGDFTKFFDMLDHNYLKRQWCSLLEVERLPKDHFAVFKNITQFSMFELTDILRLNGLDDSIGGRRALNKQQRALTKEQFRSNKSLVKKNPNPWGIPQGSPISGLLANLYMLEIDKQIYDFVSAVGGLYMRYSDDFIIVLPRKKNQDSEVILKQILTMFNAISGITLQVDKTQYFSYEHEVVSNIGATIDPTCDCSNNVINFLGFSFDGKNVRIRSKTNSKYYYRMYRKARFISKCDGYTSKGTHISERNLYEKYYERGIKKGNYLSYVRRAQKEFGSEQYESIGRDTKNHMRKIAKAKKSQK